MNDSLHYVISSVVLLTDCLHSMTMNAHRSLTSTCSIMPDIIFEFVSAFQRLLFINVLMLVEKVLQVVIACVFADDPIFNFFCQCYEILFSKVCISMRLLQESSYCLFASHMTLRFWVDYPVRF